MGRNKGTFIIKPPSNILAYPLTLEVPMRCPNESVPPRVAVIGAGPAGLAAGIALRERLGFDNFTIYEKGTTVGGVWRDNTYPGCGSDTPAHWYSLSTDLNPDWHSYYASQPELQTYWLGVFNHHKLAPYTAFNTEVIRAEWDDVVQKYRVILEDTITKEQRAEEANVILWAAGVFFAPFLPPDVPGISIFRGEAWHSAQWRHDVDLRGKRVGVIGNGCSGAQLIPEISKDPSVQVINFIRSPQWYLPRIQYDYGSWAKWVFRYIPFTARLYRSKIMASFDFGFLGFKRDSNANTTLRRGLIEYIRHTAPEQYHRELIPDYPPGCKRLIVDPSYLASLHRQNVDLNFARIDSIVEEGVKLINGDVVSLDVIVFATGFSLVPPRFDLIGRGGQCLSRFYDTLGGAAAYLGVSVPRFPNYFMLLGPNTATGHASVIFNEEVQIDHVLQLIRPIVQSKALSFEVREEAFTKYNDWVQSGIDGTVWNQCQSYYRGRSTTGKNTTLFPGSITLYWWLTRKVNFQDYVSVGAEKLHLEQRIRRLLCIIGGAFLTALATRCVRKLSIVE